MNVRNDFESLYHQYKVLVYGVALHYVQNVEDAEEITQDVFVQIYHAMDKFQNNASLKTWIYRIAINKSLDYIKQKKSKKRFFIFGHRSESATELEKLSTFEHPGIAMEQQEDAAKLFAILNELTENQRTAFILSKLDGLSNPEIAAVMNLSVSSVESLIFRAKSALKEKISVQYELYRKKK